MSRLPIVCSVCQTPLTGGLDTYGDAGSPLCWDCYAYINAGPQGEWYGLAPHHHDLSITGSILGSTVLDPLPAPNADGEYIIEQQVFVPDPHAKGLGIWSHRPLPGWR